MSEEYREQRIAVCEYARKMWLANFVSGSAGNVSVRAPGKDGIYVITPTTVAYDVMTPDNVVVCDGEGDAVIEVDNAPSFELPLHVAVYKARPDVAAVFHTHSIYSTILSIMRIPLPPLIEEMAPYLGGAVAVADYGQSGTDELAVNTVRALEDKAAVLISNHGNVCVGKTLAKAFAVCGLVERAAQIYFECLKLEAAGRGKIIPLPADVLEHEREMYEVVFSMPAE